MREGSVFKQRFEQLTKCQAFLRQSLTKKQRLELFLYKAARIAAREKRPYVEGEVVIKPVLQSFVETFEGEVFQKTVRDAVTGVALSNNTITRRIESMGKDLREQIYEDFCSSPALAIDESTDIQARNQLETPGGEKSFLRRAQIFWTTSNSFKLYPTHFFRGGRKSL